MSHNYPYRQTPNDSDHRSDPRHYNSAASADYYRRPQESFPSSSRSSAAPQSAQSPQDSVLNLLSSCGLEPGDLAVLAKLPEDVLTVDSLPHLIKQIKGKKGAVKPFPPRPSSPLPSSSSSRSFSSTYRPSTSSSSLDWDQLRRQPVQYPLHMISSSGPLSETLSDHRGAHGFGRSSSVRPVQDTDLRPRHSDYGKATSSCSSVEHKRTRPSRFSESGTSDHRSVPPPDERRRRRSGSSSASLPSADSVPSKQQALDFHGSLPSMYPYSCSLCDITVLSEKAWHEHVNGTVHADGQLKLLQQFPNWDCRLKHSNRNEDQSHRKRAGAVSAPLSQRPNQNQTMAQPNKKVTKPSDRGRVVCVKFPAQSVDEAYLQACIEPFGKMGKILMFPSVAFVELGTAEQAKDLVKFYTNLDPAENKRQLDLSISNTFSFLQSSQVVSFTPAPSGRDGRSDLISIIKRFGEPLYSLFLPSKAFVEMKLPADAKKLVEYYSSNILKLNDDSISVSFSTEYKTLMRVSLATRCDEEATETVASSTGEPSSEQRTRSESRSTGRPRNRSRSRDRSKGRSGRGSRSRDRSRREGRSRSREKKKDKSNRDTKSKSEERSSSSATGQNQTEEEKEEPKKPEEPEKTEEPEGSEKTEEPEEPEKTEEPEGSEKTEEPNESTEPGADTRSAGEPEEDSGPGAEEEQLHDEQKFSAEDSDIEGMEVIAEDGEKLKDEDAKSQEEESQEETNHPEEAAASPEGEDDNEVKSMEIDEPEEEVKNEEAEEEERSRVKSEEEEHEAADTEDDEELGFPVDLENCITLDEVDCEDEGEADQGDGSELSEPSRVLFFSKMPEDYTDMDFIQVMRGLGTVVRYLLMNDRQQGCVEMWTPSEAQKAVEVLESEPVHINGTRLMGHLSQEYSRLTDGWAVPSDEDQEIKTSTDRPPELETSGTFQKEKTDETLELETSGTFQKTDETLELETSGTFQEKMDETSELETSGTFQEKMDETSELETSGTFQEEKTDETSELETSGTFQEEKTDETPENETSENRSVRRTRSKKVPQTTSDRKTRSKKIPNKENSEKAPQRRTRSKMSPEETTEVSENVSETSPDTKTSVEETPETEETSSSSKTCEELRTTSEKELTGRKAVKGKTTSRKSPETRTDKRRGTPEDTVPLKTMKTEAGQPPEDTNRPKDGREESTVESLETKPEPEVKESEDLDHLEPPEQDSEMEHQPAAAEPEKPSKPVGPEFVRPVVGYFCNLCQLIFIDEDEAKLQHCSTLEHYRKYQEKTGKDPWSS